MKSIIVELIKVAKDNNDYELMEHIKGLIDKFSDTMNCPSNWRDIGEELADEYNESDFEFEYLQLWNHKN